MKCGDCINYGTCRLTCNVVRTSDICSSFLGKLSCDGCKYDNDRFSDICYHDCIMFSDYEKEYIGEPIVKDESISCGNCSNDDEDGCRVACIRKEYFAPKETKMKQSDIDNIILGNSQINNPDKWSVKMKPQFTEEEAHDFCVDMQFSNVLTVKQYMREKGYILKSDHEILIEEAEELFNNRRQHEWSWVMSKQNDCIQQLKTELNKRKDK